MAKPTTYKQLVKTFKFRAKKEKESPKAYISARGKAMGKEWRKIKKELEAGSKKKTTPKKTTATKKKTAAKRKGPAKKKTATKKKTTRKK